MHVIAARETCECFTALIISAMIKYNLCILLEVARQPRLLGQFSD